MEARFAKMEQLVKTLTAQVEKLQKENEALLVDANKLPEDTKPSHNKQGESRGVGGMDVDNEEKKKMQYELRDLMGKYEEMAKRVGASSLVDQMLTGTNLPYSRELMAMPPPPKFKVSQIDLYDGSKDPFEHLDTFKAYITLHGFPKEIAYRSFPLTLKGATRAWFTSLAPNSIYSFEDLARLFIMQFMASRKRRHPEDYLLTIKQQEDESLKAYLARFNKERMSTDEQEEKIILAAFLGSIWPQHPFMAELARKTHTTLQEFMDQADQFINAKTRSKH